MAQTSVMALAIKSGGDPMAFYGAAATVLPVLLVSLIYQANILERMPWEPDSIGSRGPRGFAYWILYLNVAAEATAFFALAAQTPSTQTKVLIGLGLFTSVATLLWQQTVLSLSRHTQRLEREGRRDDLHGMRRELRIASFFFPLAIAIPFAWWALWTFFL